MRISTSSRRTKFGTAPRIVCLGRSRLRIACIVHRQDGLESCTFETRLLDGRHFVLRHILQLDAWELVAVYGRGGPRHARIHEEQPLGREPLPALARPRRRRFFARCAKAVSAVAHAWRPSPGASGAGLAGS